MYLSVFLSVCVLLAIEPIVSHVLTRHTSLSYTQIPQMIFSKMEGRGAHESLPLAEKLPTVHGSYGRECHLSTGVWLQMECPCFRGWLHTRVCVWGQYSWYSVGYKEEGGEGGSIRTGEGEMCLGDLAWVRQEVVSGPPPSQWTNQLSSWHS